MPPLISGINSLSLSVNLYFTALYSYPPRRISVHVRNATYSSLGCSKAQSALRIAWYEERIKSVVRIK